MLRKTVVLKDLEGIHARNSAKIVMACMDTQTSVRLEHGGRRADGGNILEIMALNARYGDEIQIVTEGIQEQEVAEKIEKVLNGGMV